MYKNLSIWIVIFAGWFAWESAALIFIRHSDWGILASLYFLGINVAYGAAWSLLLGIVQTVLARKIRILRPTAGIAVASLLSVPVILRCRDSMIRNNLPPLSRWLTAAVLIVGIYALCVLVARWALPVWNKRRTLLVRLLLIFTLMPVALLFPFPLRQKATGTARGPVRFVVLISIDTLRYDYVGAYGVNKVSTPHIDKAAREGALFEYAISLIPHTGPSHTSMFTGKPPLVHGIHFNGQPLPQNSSITLTQRLRQAGFRTGGFISGIPLKVYYSGLNRGFQTYDDHLSWSDNFSETYYGLLWDTIPFHTRCLRRTAREVTEPALKWLNDNADQPFFLFLHFYDPHYPYGSKAASNPVNPWEIIATPEDLPQQKRLYAQQVEAVDEQIGRIMEGLRHKGIYDQTLLIITSDHGESLGEHNYYYGHDYFVYEQLLRVPLVVRCPRLLKSGTIVKRQVALLDIYKTILDAVGLKPDSGAEGHSLIRTEQQEHAILSHNFVSEVHSMRTDDFKLIRNDKNSKQPFELYDLVKDPAENTNLYLMDFQRVQQLKNLMTQQFAYAQAGATTWKLEDLTPEQIENLRSLGYFN